MLTLIKGPSRSGKTLIAEGIIGSLTHKVRPTIVEFMDPMTLWDLQKECKWNCSNDIIVIDNSNTWTLEEHIKFDRIITVTMENNG